MRTPFYSSLQLLAALGLGSFASLAAAGTGGAVITYGPVMATAVPAISGALLIVLAALMMLIAFRLIKHRPQSGANLVIAVVAIASLATGAGGVKLMADAHAVIPGAQMTDSSGGTLGVPSGISRVVNATAVPQKIIEIEYSDGCSLNNGGSVGACSTTTILAAQSANYCDIDVLCPPSTCAFTWNPNFYVDFSGSEFVDSGNYWSDPDCTVANGNLSRKWVFSPSGQANATSICVANLGAGFTAIASHGQYVFECVL